MNAPASPDGGHVDVEPLLLPLPPLLDPVAPLLEPVASSPPLELPLPLPLEPLLVSAPDSSVLPLLEPLLPLPPLLLLQPEANEKHAAIERMEDVMRMRRSMMGLPVNREGGLPSGSSSNGPDAVTDDWALVQKIPRVA